MIQFYAPDIENTHSLSVEESLHCVRVLRKRSGDVIHVTDGRGTRYECRILEADTRDVKLEIVSRTEVAKNWDCRIILAVAPTKNADRMAWLVEKATEIGVDGIRFVSCRHSERKNVNTDRLRRNAISAMNQSLKARLPEIREVTFRDLIETDAEGRFFGYCDEKTERVEFVNEYVPGSDVVIAIGPEGDFSEEEVGSLREAGFKAVTLGKERLRTETAALYSVTAVHVINNMLNR